MTQIFDNAVVSIRIGIEDFEMGSDERMLSAARNYYAGLLLLAKECLVQQVPEAEAMEVIGARFKPKPDGDGGVVHIPDGYTTVDLGQLKKRFKDFGLDWPDADIAKLQRFRNDLEHMHLKEPASALKEAIASSFPMIVDFFETLGQDPKEELGEAWETVLTERKAFEKVQGACVISLEKIDWPTDVSRLDRLKCPECSSSLVGQEDAENTDREALTGKCFQCGAEIDYLSMMHLVVEASFGYDFFSIIKDGGVPPVNTCPECAEDTYIEAGEASVCFNCGVSVAGECCRCSARIDVNEFSPDHVGLCSYCAHMYDKMMRE